MPTRYNFGNVFGRTYMLLRSTCICRVLNWMLVNTRYALFLCFGHGSEVLQSLFGCGFGRISVAFLAVSCWCRCCVSTCRVSAFGGWVFCLFDEFQHGVAWMVDEGLSSRAGGETVGVLEIVTSVCGGRNLERLHDPDNVICSRVPLVLDDVSWRFTRCLASLKRSSDHILPFCYYHRSARVQTLARLWLVDERGEKERGENLS